MTGLLRFVVVSVALLSIHVSQAQDLFVTQNVERVQRVELFEFDSPEQSSRAIALAKSLRCPQCQNQNLVESNSPMAQDLRYLVYQKVKQGETDQQIIEFMTQRYGEFVRYNPSFNSSTWILWGAPFMLLAMLAIVVLRLMKNNRK